MKLKTVNRDIITIEYRYIISGFLALILIVFFEVFYQKINIFLEGSPDFTASAILCSLGLLLSVAAIFWGLFTLRHRQYTPQMLLMNSRIVSFENLVVLGIILIAALFLMIFIVSPNTFGELAKEDHLVEWSSSIFVFLSCLVSIACLVRCQYFLYVPKITKLTIVFFCNNLLFNCHGGDFLVSESVRSKDS